MGLGRQQAKKYVCKFVDGGKEDRGGRVAVVGGLVKGRTGVESVGTECVCRPRGPGEKWTRSIRYVFVIVWCLS